MSMIAHVTGEVAEKIDAALIIDVGGVGYEVQVAVYDFEAATLGQTIKLYTHDHIRENARELFGFSQLAAKRVFELLISVSGVGPKMAMGIISVGKPEVIRGAIASGDTVFIQRASGVGKRLAERITVDLRDKVGTPVLASAPGPSGHEVPRDDALDALLALGYTLSQANEALHKVDVSLSAPARIKKALQILSNA